MNKLYNIVFIYILLLFSSFSSWFKMEDRLEELVIERHAEIASLAESARVSVCLLKTLLSDFDRRVLELKNVQETLNPNAAHSGSLQSIYT